MRPFSNALSGLTVDLAFGHFGQFLVGRLLLIQRLIEKRCRVIAAQLLGPSDQRSIACHLVMLDGLRGSNERGIENGFVLDFADNVLGFFDDTVNRWAIDALRFLADQLEHLLQSFDVVLALAEVSLKVPA